MVAPTSLRSPWLPHFRRRPRGVGFEVGASHVAGAVFTTTGTTLTLHAFAVERITAEAAQEPAEAERISQALSRVAERLGVTGAAALALPGHLTLTKQVRTPSVARAARARIIPFEAAQAIPYPLDELVWDHAVVDDDGHELELQLTAVRRDALDPLCARAGAARIAVESVRPASQALLAAFRFNYPEIDTPVLLMDIGARTTTLVLTQGKVGRVRVVATGGDAATRLPGPLAAGLHLELVRFLAGATDTAQTRGPNSIFLLGGGSLLAGLREKLAEKTGLSVELFDPLRRVTLGTRVEVGDVLARQALPVLVGLACAEFTDRGGGRALLPPEMRQELVFRRRRPWWLGAALLLIMALAAPWWHFHRVTQLVRARTAELEAKLQPMRAQAASNDRDLAQLQALRERAAVVGGWVEERTRWREFLADLQDRLADIGDAWLDRMQVVPRSPVTPGQGRELELGGWLLDAQHPTTVASPEAGERARRLLASFQASPFVVAVKAERYDTSRPGRLRFEVTLLVKPDHAL